ncbi:hypothetical protein IFM89_022658 [Coptis chinensis]|uniref:Metalloenzyme domain-containing protein n=1 Tax=Coptis chinensis TaxID=261450 RepID=A0A835H800_9MAGN|nr:hypothetical protein IFM89_022658 [Coptis chinensis]
MGCEQPKEQVVFVLIDGLGDVLLRFGYHTPLQVAKTPNLDAIASAGVNELMDPVEAGLACGSDTAHLSLLGYDPRVYYRGWGAFESMGACLAMSPGDIASKSNFATWDDKTGIVTSRRANRHFEEEGPIFCAGLDGMNNAWAWNNYYLDNRLLLKAEPLDDTDEAKHTAEVVIELSKEISQILVSHPLSTKGAAEGKTVANVVLLRGCGLGLSLGIDILEAPGATGDYRTLLTSKATAIAKALSAPVQPCPLVFVPGEENHKPGRVDGYDFGFLHIKAIDDAGHDKANIFKVKGLEAVDQAVSRTVDQVPVGSRVERKFPIFIMRHRRPLYSCRVWRSQL